MIAVIFEVQIESEQRDQYLNLAASMLSLAEQVDGFISVERFQSLTDPEKTLSLSYFRDEHAVAQWRELSAHRKAQKKGRADVFSDYRLRVAQVVRDYGMHSRDQAPADSQAVHGQQDG